MSFIDYHGTKEDRYADVLEYAKAQQEEERRRLEEERIGKWIREFIGDSRISEMSLPDLIKCVIVRYRQLLQKYAHIQGSNEDLDTNQLWNCFCFWLVSYHFDGFPVDVSKKTSYLQTFSDKIFKLKDAVSADEHYQKLSGSIAYQKFFVDSYSLVGEKTFWKWLGSKCKDIDELNSFWDLYLQLVVLISYYFYLGVRPDSDKWIRKLETEKKILEKLKEDYKREKLMNPDITILQYPSRPKVSEPTRKTLDRARLDALIANRNFADYISAFRLLYDYGLVPSLSDVYDNLMERIPVLDNTIEKFKDNYQPDMDLFYDFYIPEALVLTANFIEYYETGIQEKTLSSIEENVVDACSKLLIAVNDKIDEICKFAAIDINASAKALDSIMSQYGHVDPAYKLK